MSTSRLNVRINNKYDTYDNWMSSELILGAGEIATTSVPTDDDTIISVKIGDGAHRFSELPWIYSLAADVHPWAKSDTKPSYAISEISGLSNELQTARMLINESTFRAECNSIAFNYGFDTLCVECLLDTDDIDTTKDDGAAVVSTYFDSSAHLINKTVSSTMTIQSKKFSVDSTPYHAWVWVDYTGDGTVSIYFSKNDGDTWIAVNNKELTDLNALVQKDVRIKLVMTGALRLRNVAWGVK